jgi:hypothetical protein
VGGQVIFHKRTGDLPQEDFAKFGYWLEKKADFFFGTPCMTYGSGDIQEPMGLHMVISTFSSLGIWQLWAIFFLP